MSIFIFIFFCHLFSFFVLILCYNLYIIAYFVLQVFYFMICIVRTVVEKKISFCRDFFLYLLVLLKLKKYTKKNTNLTFQFFVLNIVSFTLYMQYIYTPLENSIALNFKGNKKTVFIKMTI
jgi:hypothetical protein